MGTFRAWREISSGKKWLLIYDTQEWPDYYDEKNTEERCKFFDHHSKDIKNDCLVLEGGNKLNIKDEEFPSKNVIYKKLYFNAISGLLINEPSSEDKTILYSPDGLPVHTSFKITFDKEASFIGYPKVKLFMECEGYNDMDVFV